MKTTKILLGLLRVSALVALFTAVPLSAQTLLYTTPLSSQPGGTPTSTQGGYTGITIGFQFTLTSSITVTGLGLFDQGGDGLLGAHDIGIWSSTGALLDSANVGAGTSGTLVDGDFRFVAATPVTLAAGTYTLGEGETGSDPYIDFSASGNAHGIIPFASEASGTSSAVYGFAVPGTLGSTPPANSGQGNGYLGPNLEFTTVEAPEPSSSSLVTTSLAGMALLLFCKRLKKQSI